MEALGSLQEAISNICNTPLATNVPESSAAGTLNLSKKNMNINETIINKTKFQWF